MDKQQLRDALGAAVTDAPTPLAAADRLCAACVQHLDVDGASISFIDGGRMQGTFGSSGELSRTLDELQFTYGQGPCLDAVAQRRPILALDLDGPGEYRWPALTQAILDHGIRAIFALPVAVASTTIGALDLFRRRRGPLNDAAMTGGVWAAGLAALPLLDLMSSETDWQEAADGRGSWGVTSVHAVPMRLRDDIIGALNLFGTAPGVLNEADLRLAQSLADVATIALIQDRAAAAKNIVNEQLQGALDSRVVLEQAKGVLAYSGDMDMPAAFAVLRRYARDHNIKLAELSRALVNRALPAALVLDHARTRGARAV